MTVSRHYLQVRSCCQLFLHLLGPFDLVWSLAGQDISHLLPAVCYLLQSSLHLINFLFELLQSPSCPSHILLTTCFEPRMHAAKDTAALCCAK